MPRTSSISEVPIKDIEEIVGEFPRLAKGEELCIYPTEFSLVEMTGGTVFLESHIEHSFGTSVLT